MGNPEEVVAARRGRIGEHGESGNANQREPTQPAAGSSLLTVEDAAVVARLHEAHASVREEMARVVVGQEEIIDQLVIGLLCRGHVLLLGVPGLGKTLMARTLARTLDLEFRRVQFTPDLMPTDITGADVIKEDPTTGKYQLEFVPGPVFSNFLLADEINRTPPKTQAALLQAMQEQEVSIGRRTYQLAPPFYVVATQNPIEMEGTYPLPEAQLDRFMFNLKVSYPSLDEEVKIVKGTTGAHTAEAKPVLKADELLRLQELVRGVPIADSVIRYAARLASATRPVAGQTGDGFHKYISYGASPAPHSIWCLPRKDEPSWAGGTTWTSPTSAPGLQRSCAIDWC